MRLRPTTLGNENQRRPRESGDPLWGGRKMDSRFRGNDGSGRDFQESQPAARGLRSAHGFPLLDSSTARLLDFLSPRLLGRNRRQGVRMKTDEGFAT
jgi:hypothetical protein